MEAYRRHREGHLGRVPVHPEILLVDRIDLGMDLLDHQGRRREDSRLVGTDHAEESLAAVVVDVAGLVERYLDEAVTAVPVEHMTRQHSSIK